MKRILCIGQAPPKTNPSKPFGRTKLYSWFREIGIDDFKVYDERSIWDAIFEAKFNNQKVLIGFGAIHERFPGSNKHGHLAPTHDQILESRNYLKDYFNSFKPDLLVAIGKQSIQYALNDFDLQLNDSIGKSFIANPYGLYKKIPIIPLPHPSGASTWFYKRHNAILLTKALLKISEILT